MQATGNKTFSPYTLSIRITADGFSFFLNNATEPALVRHEAYSVRPGESLAEALREALAASPLAAKATDRIFVISTLPATRVPLDHFRQDEAETLYRLTFPEANLRTHSLFYNILPSLEVAELCLLDKQMEQVLKERFAHHLHRISAGSCVAETLKTYEDACPQHTRRLYAVFGQADIQVFSFLNRQLQFANSYPRSTAANALYFLLQAWKSLGLDAQKDACLLIQAPADIPAALCAYLAHVEALRPSLLCPTLPQALTDTLPFDVQALFTNKL